MPDTTLEARDFAKAIALDMAEDPSDVGDFVTSQDLGDGVTDFRFESHIAGYEGWQWSVTMYHDEELDHWTVNESSLLPTEQALLPPKWIPWKDRLEPTDLSVTDSIGTDPDDPRLEEGLTDQQIEAVADALEKEQQAADEAATATTAETGDAEADSVSAESAGAADAQSDTTGESADAAGDKADAATTSALDMAEAIDEFELSRRHVLSSLGRAQTAKRWYEGPHGPKALSTKTAGGSVCETCGFFIPLKGDLSRMFGVCANKWSPDDGRVVSLDHGCGEHSEIDPPQPSRLWVQSKPAFDDLHIDIVAQKPREEHGEVELLERLGERPEPEADATAPDATVPDEQEPAGESTEDNAAERAADAEFAETAESVDIAEPVETAVPEAGEDSVEPSKEETGEAGETDEEGEATVGTDGREQTADAEDADATVSIPVSAVSAYAEDAGQQDAANEPDESDDDADEATEEDIDAQTVPDDEATDEDIAEHAADHGSDDDDDTDAEEDGPEVVETVDLTER